MDQTQKNGRKHNAEHPRKDRRARVVQTGSHPPDAMAPAPIHFERDRPASNIAFGLSAFAYIDRIQSISDPKLVQETFVEVLSSLGVTNFALLEVSPNPSAMSQNVIDDKMPFGWKQRYFERRYGESDPCVSEVMTNLEPFLWREALSRSRADKLQRQIFHEAAEFGLNEGMCIPIYGPNHYMAFATLAGDQLDLAPSSRAALHVMALYTHNRLVKLVRETRHPAFGLTRRETDCLKWVAQGKSDWEIGEILKISESTAHWYIESAKRKLGVATRIQAVVGALSAGLISV